MASPHQQKLRIDGPVVVTGNRLADGAVVHYRADGGWTAELGDAAVTTDAETALAWLEAAGQDFTHAVGAYVAPVVLDEAGRPRPGNLRERIRAEGPTIALPGPGYPFSARHAAARPHAA